MELPLLELVGVGKRFGFYQVLYELDLVLRNREFVLLLGNNGVGKSTLLRIICLLMKPSVGELLLDGKPIKGQRIKWLKSIGALTHDSLLYADLTAYENLKVFGTLHDIPNLKERIEMVLKETGLIQAKKLPVHTFSSGMNKRLRIGFLILLKPRFLILDEPFTGLDQKSINWVLNFLKQYHQNGGTVLMVTHQLELGLELASRVLVLKQKKIGHDMKASTLNPAKCKNLLK